MKVKELIAILERQLPDSLVVGVWFSEEDLVIAAEDMGEELLQDELEEAIEELEQYHDAEYGITWDLIRNTIDRVVERRRV